MEQEDEKVDHCGLKISLIRKYVKFEKRRSLLFYFFISQENPSLRENSDTVYCGFRQINTFYTFYKIELSGLPLRETLPVSSQIKYKFLFSVIIFNLDIALNAFHRTFIMINSFYNMK